MRLQIGEVHLASRTISYSIGVTLDVGDQKRDATCVVEVLENMEHPDKSYEVVFVGPDELFSEISKYEGVILDAVRNVENKLKWEK